jgi:metal-dependent amidase/aminoacylase/carboxypeptidase family protein
MRTFDEQRRAQVKKLVEYHCDNIEKKYGVVVERNFGSGYPAVFNTPQLAEMALQTVAAAFGPSAIQTLGIRPTGEDFGYYTERYPSLFYRLGVGYVDDDFAAARAGALHTASFCPDTKAIGHGVVTMVLLALHFADR